MVIVAVSPSRVEPPPRGRKPVDQHGRVDAISREDQRPVLGGDHARAVGVGQQQVVVVGQESHRRRTIGDRGRGASSTSKSSTPCSSVNDRRLGRRRSITARRRVSPDHTWMSLTDAGPNAREVAQHQLVGCGRAWRAGARATPRRRCARPDPTGPTRRAAAPAPAPPRRARPSQAPGGRGRARLGASSAPSSANVRGCGVDQFAAGRRQLPGIDALEPAPEVAAQRPLDHALQHRPQRQAVGAETRWMVERCSAIRTARRRSISSPSCCGAKARDARPQRDVRRHRGLGLHPDELLDHLGHGARERCKSNWRSSRVRLRSGG